MDQYISIIVFSIPGLVGARITSVGTYVPNKRLTNFDLESIVDTSNEWIIQRTGIRERRISHSEEFTSDLCVGAVEHPSLC